MYNFFMQSFLLAAVIFLIIAFFLFIFLYLRSRDDKKGEALSLLQSELDALRKQLGESLQNTVQGLNQQFSALTQNLNLRLKEVTDQILSTKDSTSLLIADVKGNLATLAEASKRIYDVGKDIASLHDLLRAPKLRGSLGELFLGDLLSQILPKEFYTLQYKFKNNVLVDAVISLKEGLVPIDSKFPLSSFKDILDAKDEEGKKIARKRFISDVKKHIDNISTKYIRPEEGTFDFALMYIPAENVYYETIIKDESSGEEFSIFNYAISRKIIPVSPNTFYAYLQTILFGLKGIKIEEMAKRILNAINTLQIDFSKIEEDFKILGTHIQNARKRYEEMERKVVGLRERLIALSVGKESEEPKIISGKAVLDD